MNNKQQLLNNLKKVNKFLINNDDKLSICIVGGSAFLLKGFIDRSTKDIDSIKPIDGTLSSLIRNETGVDINSGPHRARTFRKFYKDWEKEVTLSKYQFSNIKIFELTDVSLIASKFFTRETDRDITSAAHSGKLKISQTELESKVIDIFDTLLVSVEKEIFYKREFEIIEFYRAMRWNYEESKIQKLFER